MISTSSLKSLKRCILQENANLNIESCWEQGIQTCQIILKLKCCHINLFSSKEKTSPKVSKTTLIKPSNWGWLSSPTPNHFCQMLDALAQTSLRFQLHSVPNKTRHQLHGEALVKPLRGCYNEYNLDNAHEITHHDKERIVCKAELLLKQTVLLVKTVTWYTYT